MNCSTHAQDVGLETHRTFHQCEPCPDEHHQNSNWQYPMNGKLEHQASYYNTEQLTSSPAGHSLESLCSVCKQCDAEQEQLLRCSSLPILDSTCNNSRHSLVHYENMTILKEQTDRHGRATLQRSQVSICSNCKMLENGDWTKSQEQSDSPLAPSLSCDSDTTPLMTPIYMTCIETDTPPGPGPTKPKSRPAQLRLDVNNQYFQELEAQNSSDSGMVSLTSEGARFFFGTTNLPNGEYLPLVGGTSVSAKMSDLAQDSLDPNRPYSKNYDQCDTQPMRKFNAHPRNRSLFHKLGIQESDV